MNKYEEQAEKQAQAFRDATVRETGAEAPITDDYSIAVSVGDKIESTLTGFYVRGRAVIYLFEDEHGNERDCTGNEIQKL